LLHAARGMKRPTDTNPPSAVNRLADQNGEPYLGGADSVEKTTYVADVHGASVNDAEQAPVGLTATVPHQGGLGSVGWIAVVVGMVILAAYAAALIS